VGRVKKIAKHTMGSIVAVLFAVGMVLLAIIALFYLTAILKNAGV